MDTLLEVRDALTSKRAQRTALNASFFIFAALALLPPAILATLVFHSRYLPRGTVTQPVYLQYGVGANPFGVASLASSRLQSQQQYDIDVILSLPQSESNRERGNFMIALSLLRDDITKAPAPTSTTTVDQASILFRSRRPALLPYIDPLVYTLKSLAFLPYYALVPRSQTWTLRSQLADKVLFATSDAIPRALHVEIEAGQDIQTYSVDVVISAQLRGLRWFMYYFRIPSLFLFTSLFWSVEIVFTGLSWFLWGGGLRPPSGIKDEGGDYWDDSSVPGKSRTPKREEEYDVSDTPRTFPAYGKQPALKYEGEPHIKEEPREYDDYGVGGHADEADDEEEFHTRPAAHLPAGGTDSGIGTSFSEGSGSTRRRTSVKGE